MSDIINLRLARKAKKRAADQQDAAENRVRHGRSKAEKKLDNFNAEQEQRRQDGQRLLHDKTDAPTKQD